MKKSEQYRYIGQPRLDYKYGMVYQLEIQRIGLIRGLLIAAKNGLNKRPRIAAIVHGDKQTIALFESQRAFVQSWQYADMPHHQNCKCKTNLDTKGKPSHAKK